MTYASSFNWFKRVWSRFSTNRRRARRPALSWGRCLEELESRQLLSAVSPWSSAIPLALSGGHPVAGVIGQAPTYYAVSVTDPGRLIAEVAPTGGATRLTLLSSDGSVLMQSDGQSPSNPNDLIDLHLTASETATTYYLEVEGLGNSTGSYVLTASYATTTVPYQSLAVGTEPLSVATGDFNGDGKVDLAVANFYGNSVTIYLGAGDGTFGAPQDYAVGVQPDAIVVGDFNGDGRLDIATASLSSGTVSILRGNGDGTFASAVEYAAGAGATALTAGDFNGDGKLDLAVADSGSNAVSVLVNRGDGTFAPPLQYAVGANPHGIVAGDFNGDGRLDLATANAGSNNVSVLLGNGDGTFAAQTTIAVGQVPHALVAGDFRGDGRIDLATANAGSNDVSVLLGQGDGTFTPQAPLAAGSGPTAIVAADFNGDGHTDLAVADMQDGTISIFLGQGTGTFDPQKLITAGQAPASLAAADFNHDGFVDLAFTHSGIDTVDVALGKGDGNFFTRPLQSLAASPISTVSADVNGDGRLDVVTVNAATHTVTILLGQGDGTFRFGGIYATGGASRAIAVGDVNGDGIPDLVLANTVDNTISVLLGRGDGTFGPPSLIPAGPDVEGIVLGDFNGDGHLDVATSDALSNQVSILFGDGTGKFARPVNYNVGNSPMGLTAGDFNHDGHLDLAVANKGSADVSVLLNNGDGTFAPQVRLQAGLSPFTVRAADLNGDGTLDLAVPNLDSGTVSVFLGDGHGGFASQIVVPTGDGPTQVLVGDFNHDGKLDLATTDMFSQTMTILRGRGDGTFQQAGQIPVGDAIDGAVGDFNGDGNPDVVVVNRSQSALTVLLGKGDGTFRAAMGTAIAQGPTAIAALDLNSDGDTDVVTANPSTGTVEVSVSNGDGTFQAPQAIHVGGEPIAVATGDFNRDDRPGIAVADYQGNTVTILDGLGDGTFRTVQSIPVGNHPDALAAGAFDNDGSTELAVANYGSGTVTILDGSQDGTFTINQVIAVGHGPVALSVGDVNGDGTLDLVVANALSGSITILEGNGDGTFRLTGTIALGTTPAAVVTGDFNGDGNMDIATADRADNAVSVLLGNGDGTFRAPVQFATGTGPVSIVTADFNGSGHLDLATANNNSNDVSVLWGNGDGTFQTPSSVPVGLYPNALLVADLNNDGHPDIVTANGLGEPISVALGLNKNTFANPDLGAHPIRSTPLVGDLTGTGQADVAILTADGKILVRLADPNVAGAFKPPMVANPDAADGARDLTLVTVNGRQELAALDARTGSIVFYSYAADARFVRTQGPAVSATNLMVRIVAGDLNGDGRQDLVVDSSGSSHNSIRVYLQQPDGTFVLSGARIFVGVSASDVDLVNLSGGPGPDIVVTDQFSGEVRVLLNTLTAPFTTQRVFRTGTGLYDVTQAKTTTQIESSEAPIALVAGKFTGAATDLVVLSSGSDQFDLLAGDGRGGFFNPVTALANRTGWAASAIVSGDLNGDGIPDLAVLDKGSGQVLIYLGDGKGGFVPNFSVGPNGQPLGLAAGNAPDSLTVAALDNSGRPDLLIGNANGDVLILQGNGDGTFRPYQRLDRHVALAVIRGSNDAQPQFVFANQSLDQVVVRSGQAVPVFQQGRQDGVLAPNAVVLADLNGDGIPDLIVANGGGNDVLVYAGLSNGQFGPAQRFFVGTDPVGITVADLRGNGILDVVIANRGSNDVSILYGQGQGASWTLTPGPRLRAGVGPTATVVQDTNGDGVPDILVANGGSNNVYALSGTGNGFFDDTHPVVYQTGADPVQLFVGHFDNSTSLDLVTVNAGSNDLTLFADFGAARTVDAGGIHPVAALAYDLNHDGPSELIVANADGHFALLQGGENGLQLTTIIATGLVNVSDMALSIVTSTDVQVYATTQSGETAFPIIIGFDSQPISGFGVSHLPAAPLQVTEISALPESPLGLVASLALVSEFSAPSLPSSTAESSSVVSYMSSGSQGEGDDAVSQRVVQGDEAPRAGDADSLNRNSVITGATEAPVQQHLDRPRMDTPADVPFPSPLNLFDGSGQTFFSAPIRQAFDGISRWMADPNVEGPPASLVPQPPAQTEPPPAGETGSEPIDVVIAREPANFGLAHFRATFVYLTSAFVVLESPVLHRHRDAARKGPNKPLLKGTYS
jgi:hypothetical protein